MMAALGFRDPGTIDAHPNRAGSFLPRRSSVQIWIAILLAAAYLAIGSFALPFKITADGSEYLQMAQNMLGQHAFSYDGVNPVAGKPPGFPFLIAAYLKYFGSIQGFQVVLLLCMCGSFLLLMISAWRLVGARWALGLLAVLAGMFPLNGMVENLWSEPPFLLLSSLGMALLLQVDERSDRCIPLLAGAAFGAATYFRPVTLMWPIAILLLAGLFCRRYWRRFLPVAVVHLVLVAPWIYRNWSEFKTFVPMVANWAPLYYLTEAEMWKIYFYEGSGVVRDMPEHKAILEDEFQFNWRPNQRFKEMAVRNIAGDPSGYLGRCFTQALFAWTYLPGTKQWYRSTPFWFSMGRVAMILFYAVTFTGLLSLWKRRKSAVVLLGGYAFYTGIMLFPVCTESRYLVPAYFWLLPLTLAGVTVLAEKMHIGQKSWSRTVGR